MSSYILFKAGGRQWEGEWEEEVRNGEKKIKIYDYEFSRTDEKHHSTDLKNL